MGYKYKAFISYNHNDRDTAVAETLHRMIETYKIPRKLRKNGAKTPGAVFRDKEKMPLTPDVEKYLFEQLDASEFLIVICSPGAVNSPWVLKEINHFLETRRSDNVLTVMTDGDPNEILCQLLPNLNPKYLDLIGSTEKDIENNLETLFLPLCAPLIGCTPVELSKVHLKRQIRKIMTWTLGIIAIILVLLWSGWQVNEKEQELAEQKEQILQRESDILINDAAEQLEAGDRAAAMEVALRILDSEGRPYYAPAEELLIRALDMFDAKPQESLIPATVLEHVNPVSAFCLSQDESKLFLVDINNYVVCYDTATGQRLWDQKDIQDALLMPGIVYSSSYEHRLQYGDKSITAVGDNVIIHDYNVSMIALSQQTGEVQWQHEYQMYWSNVFFSGNQQVLCHVRYDGGDDGLQYVTEFLDTSTGSVLQTVPFPEAPGNKEQPSLGFSGSSDDLFNGGALTEDGRLFAGAYVEDYPDGSTILCYYVADRFEGTCHVFHRQEMTIDSEFFGTVIRFTDQDQTLTIFRNTGDKTFACTVEKYRLSDWKRLWSVNTPSEEQKDFSYLYRLPCLELEDHILLGCQDRLWLIDGDSGKTADTLELSAHVLGLFPLADGTFAVMLESGEYFVCYVDGSVIAQTDLYYTFSPTNQAAATAFGLSLPDGAADPTLRFLVTVPDRQPHRILLHRLVSTEEFFLSVDTGIRRNEITISDIILHYMDEDTLLLGGSVLINENAQEGDYLYELFSRYRYALIDPKTYQLQEYLELPWFSTFLQWLPDYENVLFFNKDGYFGIYSPDSALHFPLSDGYTTERDEFGEMNYLSTEYLIDAKLCPSIQSLLVVVCKEEQIDAISIRDFSYQSDYRNLQSTMYSYPLPSRIIDNTTLKMFELRIGENGFFAIPFYREDETLFSGCAFYDTNSHQFIEFDAVNAYHDIWLGRHTPVAAMMTNVDTIDILDTTNGSTLCRIPLSLPYTSVEYIQFLLDDSYLMVQTSAGQLSIYSTATGELMYSERDENMSVSSELYFAEDASRHRLYIQTSTLSGSCIDTRTWTKIAEIPWFAAYDVQSNTIYRWIFYEEMNANLIACTLPGTEELITIAKSLLE